MMAASPPARGFEGSASGDDGRRGHRLVVDLPVRPAQPRNGSLEVAALEARKDPLVQTLATVAQAVVQALVGARDEAVEGH
jgi:hypothetical protein